MRYSTKKKKIKVLVKSMLKMSQKAMLENIDKALNCGALDIDNWSDKESPMILPKIIISTLLESESIQYQGKGTSFEKKIKKEIKNLKYFI